MSSPTLTPNIGLQVPGNNQANWQVQINYDLNRLDLIFGGTIQVPALNVIDLTVENLIATNILAALAQAFVSEEPDGAVPGTVYTLSTIPVFFFALYINGIIQLSSTYTVSGNLVTLNIPSPSGAVIQALYFNAG